MPDIFSKLKEIPFGDFGNKRTVLEIGAADCGDTKSIMDAVGFVESDGFNYYAFEPDPDNISEIRTLSTASMSNFHLLELAVGNENRMAEFLRSSGFNENLHKEHRYSGSLKQPVIHLKEHPWCKFCESIQVKMETLDSIVARLNITSIDLIWCDVQGSEDLVIAGGQKAFEMTRFFYTEFYNMEMYQGQLTDSQIIERLPGQWETAGKWANDMLLKRL